MLNVAVRELLQQNLERLLGLYYDRRAWEYGWRS